MRYGTVQFLYCCDKKFVTKFRAFRRSLKKSKGVILTYNEELDINFNTTYNRQCKKCDSMNRATITYEMAK